MSPSRGLGAVHRKQHWKEFLGNSDHVWKPAKIPGLAGDHLVRRSSSNQESRHRGRRRYGEPRAQGSCSGHSSRLRRRASRTMTRRPGTTSCRGDRLQNTRSGQQSPEPARTAPGRDGLPARVWRDLWPVLGDKSPRSLSSRSRPERYRENGRSRRFCRCRNRSERSTW